MTEVPGVSVVICCHNSKTRLASLLSCLAAQYAPRDLPWEIVVVDNGSSDGTARVATAMWGNLGSPVQLRVEYEPRLGLAYARRVGVCRTRYSVVVLCDDDNLLEPDYVVTALGVVNEYPQTGVIGGHTTPVAEVPLPEWFHSNAWSYAVGSQAPASGDVTESRGYLWGAGMVLRAAPLRHLYRAGWRPLLSDRRGTDLSAGGDSEICKWYIAGGWRLRYDERLQLSHVIPAERLTLEYLEAQGAGFEVSQRILSGYDRCIARDALRRSSSLLEPARIRSELATLVRSWRIAWRWRRLQRDLVAARLTAPAAPGVSSPSAPLA